MQPVYRHEEKDDSTVVKNIKHPKELSYKYDNRDTIHEEVSSLYYSRISAQKERTSRKMR